MFTLMAHGKQLPQHNKYQPRGGQNRPFIIMNLQHKKEIESSVLNMVHEQHITASFYLHDVVDTNNESLTNAKEQAIEHAIKRTNITGKEKEPDFSADNLKRLGAVQMMKKVPYVSLKRLGAIDYKSSLVLDEHKQTYPEQWAKFQEANHDYFENIRAERENVQTCEDRPIFNQTGGGQTIGFGGFNYQVTFTNG